MWWAKFRNRKCLKLKSQKLLFNPSPPDPLLTSKWLAQKLSKERRGRRRERETLKSLSSPQRQMGRLAFPLHDLCSMFGAHYTTLFPDKHGGKWSVCGLEELVHAQPETFLLCSTVYCAVSPFPTTFCCNHRCCAPTSIFRKLLLPLHDTYYYSTCWVDGPALNLCV